MLASGMGSRLGVGSDLGVGLDLGVGFGRLELIAVNALCSKFFAARSDPPIIKSLNSRLGLGFGHDLVRGS